MTMKKKKTRSQAAVRRRMRGGRALIVRSLLGPTFAAATLRVRATNRDREETMGGETNEEKFEILVPVEGRCE